MGAAVDLVRSGLRYLYDQLYFAEGGTTRSLHAHERTVLDAVVATLPEPAQRLLQSQLSGRMMVTRVAGRIATPRFYGPPYLRDDRRIDGEDFDEKIVDVFVTVDGVAQTAHVVFLAGKLESVQFKRPVADYAGKDLLVISTRPGKWHLTHAAALDRLEHGRNEDER